MRLARIGLVVGGLACLLITPWFALAYFAAYGGTDEIPPPWKDWVDWPVLISGDAEAVYNRYGVIFGVGLLVVVVSLAGLVRRSTVKDSGIRRSWMLIVGGLGAVAFGSLLEYGFGDYIDPSFGFSAELLGFVAVMIGTGLLGRFLRKEADLGTVASVGVGISGFLAVAIGVVLVGHLPSGPALIPLIAAVIFGLTGLPKLCSYHRAPPSETSLVEGDATNT